MWNIVLTVGLILLGWFACVAMIGLTYAAVEEAWQIGVFNSPRRRLWRWLKRWGLWLYHEGGISNWEVEAMKKFAECPTRCPDAGDVFVCQTCDHTILTVKACSCTDKECVCHACCGAPMLKVNGEDGESAKAK